MGMQMERGGSAAGARPEAGSADGTRSSTLLVVDDDEAVRTAVARILRSEGHAVLPVGSVQDAVEVLDGTRVDLALLDVMLPDGSGVELCRAIRADRDSLGLPVILMTGFDSDDLRREGLAAGADELLRKPVVPVELILRVQNLLRVRELHHRVLAQKASLEERVEERTRALQASVSDLARVRDALRRSHAETIHRLSRAAEFRDPETGQHLERVSRYADLIARRIGLDEARQETIRLASPLHDVGKLAVPDGILLKPGRLAPAERALMEQHTRWGHEMLAGSGEPLLDVAASIALTHHERYDGSGYPAGLAGDAIPLEGRIVAVADVFDALTSVRPYKLAYPVAQSFDILREGAGTQFDPRLVAAFVDARREVEAVWAATGGGGAIAGAAPAASHAGAAGNLVSGGGDGA